MQNCGTRVVFVFSVLGYRDSRPSRLWPAHLLPYPILLLCTHCIVGSLSTAGSTSFGSADDITSGLWVTPLRFRFASTFKWTAAQGATLPSGNGLAGPSCPACPRACPNIFYMNILMSSFHIAPCSAQLACERNLGMLNAPHL